MVMWGDLNARSGTAWGNFQTQTVQEQNNDKPTGNRGAFPTQPLDPAEAAKIFGSPSQVHSSPEPAVGAAITEESDGLSPLEAPVHDGLDGVKKRVMPDAEARVQQLLNDMKEDLKTKGRVLKNTRTALRAAGIQLMGRNEKGVINRIEPDHSFPLMAVIDEKKLAKNPGNALGLSASKTSWDKGFLFSPGFRVGVGTLLLKVQEHIGKAGIADDQRLVKQLLDAGDLSITQTRKGIAVVSLTFPVSLMKENGLSEVLRELINMDSPSEKTPLVVFTVTLQDNAEISQQVSSREFFTYLASEAASSREAAMALRAVSQPKPPMEFTGLTQAEILAALQENNALSLSFQMGIELQDQKIQAVHGDMGKPLPIGMLQALRTYFAKDVWESYTLLMRRILRKLSETERADFLKEPEISFSLEQRKAGTLIVISAPGPVLEKYKELSDVMNNEATHGHFVIVQPQEKQGEKPGKPQLSRFASGSATPPATLGEVAAFVSVDKANKEKMKAQSKIKA